VLITENLKLIFGRIKIRVAVYKFEKLHCEKEVSESKRRRTSEMGDRLDLPAANLSILSTQKVLRAIKGSSRKSSRLNKMDENNATQWTNKCERFNSMTEDLSKKLQSIAADMELTVDDNKANLENAIPSSILLPQLKPRLT